MGMTIDEAISWLEPFIWHEGEDVPIYDTDVEAIKMGIKALKRESVIDKISAEVLEYIDDVDIAYEICGIFDKYKIESEEKDESYRSTESNRDYFSRGL